MQEKFILILTETDQAPSWAIVDAEGKVRQSAWRDSAEGLAQIAEDKEIIVIVPAQDIVLTSVKLPKMSRARLMQALPFALEEQLIAEVDTLHFAPGAYQADESLPVAVVAQEKMQQWQQQLQTWGMKADMLIPAVFALPIEEHAWYVSICELSIVRMGEFQGFACDTSNLPALLSLALTDKEPPARLYLHYYADGENKMVLPLNKTIYVEEIMSEPAEWIEAFASYVIRTPYINLLQGPYAVKKSRFSSMQRMWKTAASLAAAWVVLLFLGPIISSLILSQRVNELNGQIAEIYKRHFPHSVSLIAPKLRMQEKLQKLSGAENQNRLLMLLGYIGSGVQERKNIKLKRFEFQNNQLTLELTADTSEDFSAFTDFLSRKGLNVKQQNANLAGTRINAALLIE